MPAATLPLKQILVPFDCERVLPASSVEMGRVSENDVSYELFQVIQRLHLIGLGFDEMPREGLLTFALGIFEGDLQNGGLSQVIWNARFETHTDNLTWHWKDLLALVGEAVDRADETHRQKWIADVTSFIEAVPDADHEAFLTEGVFGTEAVARDLDLFNDSYDLNPTWWLVHLAKADLIAFAPKADVDAWIGQVRDALPDAELRGRRRNKLRRAEKVVASTRSDASSARARRKRLPLPKRFSAGLTEEAYGRLRALNEVYGLGNNYLLTVLLERLDDYADADRLDAVFRAFIAEYGAPGPAKGGKT
ncbi:MAG: hypothetical protein AAGE18_09535 [Pseudomonadota bacterium]